MAPYRLESVRGFGSCIIVWVTPNALRRYGPIAKLAKATVCKTVIRRFESGSGLITTSLQSATDRLNKTGEPVRNQDTTPKPARA